MHPLICRSVLALAAIALASGAPLAKQLNLQPPRLTPQIAPRTCPPSMVGTWPNCTCPPNKVLYKGTCLPLIFGDEFCLWRENNGTPFGISGVCAVPYDSAVGSPCTCTSTVEHKVIVKHGTVVAAPPPAPPSTLH